jgi:hypothetical protein
MRLLCRISILLFAGVTFAQTPTRLSWQEFARDPNRVASFRKAVATMKSRNSADKSSAEYRKSWEYWANMHGYFGETAKNGTVAQWREANGLTDQKWDRFFEGVENTAPPDAIAQAVWDQCEHRTDYFFPWHRLFLYYFERVLQESAGDESLRLPYWDYTDPAQLEMPAEFREPSYVAADGRTLDNPLYEKRRADGWQANLRKLNSKDTDIDLALDNPNYLDTTDASRNTVPGYRSTIEGSPHGYVHCAVIPCRGTVMGAVPYSSNDPIFWIHHCNIDRLLDCWLSIDGHEVPQSLMSKQYSFVDENGAQVTKRVRNLFDGSLIDYVYEQPSSCGRKQTTPSPRGTASAATVDRARAALRRPVSIGIAQTLAINAQVASKRVTLPATASVSHPRQFALRDQEQLPIATELILRGIHFQRHPVSSFAIYLARVDDSSRRAFVGTLSFFSEEADGDAHAHHGGAVTRVFDATDALQDLGLEGTGTLSLDVVLEAVDEPSIEGPEFDPAASRVVVDEIELRVKRDV